MFNSLENIRTNQYGKPEDIWGAYTHLAVSPELELHLDRLLQALEAPIVQSVSVRRDQSSAVVVPFTLVLLHGCYA